MRTKGLLFLWGVLASCLVLSADGSTIPSFDEIMANFQESRFLDIAQFEEPTEQEWIEIITETLQGNSMPKYLAGKNYALYVDETGHFNESKGLTGSWNSTKYINYDFTDIQALRQVINVKSEKIGDSYFESGTELITMFTFFGQSYVKSHAIFGASFVKNGNDLEKRENFHGFGYGRDDALSKDEVKFHEYGMMLVNRSEGFSVSEVAYGGLVLDEKYKYFLDAALFKNSLPLSNVDVASLPKNPEALAGLLRATKASTPHVTATAGTVFAEQMFGEIGYYEGDMDAVTRVFPDLSFNTTTYVEATYVNMQTDDLLVIQNLIDINNPFLG